MKLLFLTTILFFSLTVNAQFDLPKITSEMKGEQQQFFDNGELKASFTVDDGVFNGPMKLYHPTGEIRLKGEFLQGFPQGTMKEFYEVGTLKAKGDFKNGSGRAEFYDVSGKKVRELRYSNSKLIFRGDYNGEGTLIDYFYSYESAVYNDDSDLKERVDEVWRASYPERFEDWEPVDNDLIQVQEEVMEASEPAPVTIRTKENSEEFGDAPKAIIDYPDVDAEFPGGIAAMNRFIGETIYYPQYAIEENIQGRVYLSFVVEQDGSISNLKVERGVHITLDKAAIRTILLMPKWVPGEAQGYKCRTRCRLPIVFTLE